jgi:Leucine rich repeat
MGRKATGLPLSAEATVSKTNTKTNRHKPHKESDYEPSNPEISDFMMALGVQDNINLQPDAIVTPGAVLVRPSWTDAEDETHTVTNEEVTDIVIAAHLAPDAADMEAMVEERWAARMAQEMEKRTRQRTQTTGVSLVNDDDVVVLPDEGKEEWTHPEPKRQRRWIMVILLLLFIAGGLVVFLVVRDKDDKLVDSLEALSQSDAPSYAPSFSPVEVDPLVEELRSWIAPTREDLLRLLEPTSAQSQALDWLHNDPVTLTTGRSTRSVLERYVLAVLYYSTSGPSWKFDYLSDDDVCTWNNQKAATNNSQSMLGVYCVEGGTSVGTVALSENKLRGTLPWELSLLTSLEVMDLGLNSLSGSIPTQIVQMTDLQVIVVLWNVLTGQIPKEISELTRLEAFWGSENKLTGPLPVTFSPFTVEIDLGGNSFTGTIPDSWGTTMPSLDFVFLHDNRLTGSIPFSFGRLSYLSDLFLYSNLLTGPLPTTFSSSLTSLLIDDNTFTGSIPSTWGSSIPNLWVLALAQNSLTGRIPPSLFAALTNLEYLTAGDNFLSGPLPESFPASISDIHLPTNALTGPIPSTWGDMLPNLGSLAIHGNLLTGSIPVSLGQIPTLTSFTFHSNSLTGSVDFLCDVGNWTSLEADCPVPITCSCCTICHDV